MISFYKSINGSIIAVEWKKEPNQQKIKNLKEIFNPVEELKEKTLFGEYFGPFNETPSPASTLLSALLNRIGFPEIERVEEYLPLSKERELFDPLLHKKEKQLGQALFSSTLPVAPIIEITNIEEYNKSEGLALNSTELEYLKSLSKKIGRPLTDSEVFGYSQVNSEHCRHKIFNGTFIIDGKKRESTLFQLIKRTAKLNPNFIVSAYSDNCALIKGPTLSLFHPQKGSEPSNYIESKSDTVITLKAETHNYPTTVEPFGGASTGAGGEIRDRMAGGQGAIPSAGFAVYMTPYSRLNSSIRDWESKFQPRKWLYQLPKDILLKATCGASHYGNMFGQPLICGSLLTYELFEEEKKYAFDKVIMLAGGVGYTKREYAFKERLSKGDKVVMMGGDNYRIGMGGGAVSSVETGEFDRATVQNAIQRANPEIQKRVFNVVRALVESTNNVIVSIHDHGAGGHLNCFSELVEGSGGKIDITKLPIGDSTLSAKEIISNESQERMGLVVRESDLPIIEAIAKREEAPIYVVGESTQDNNFTLYNSTNKEKAVDLNLSDLLGSLPPLKIEGESVEPTLLPLQYDVADVNKYIELVLQLDSVACKDWITNKVDRSATALIAAQQTVGELQLPLGNVGVVEIGYGTKKGMATSIGHAPAVALIDAAAGSRVAIARALTNLVWAPLTEGLKGVSLSANWMWPCKNRGEEARLYSAVESASNFAVELGINIPTGKDSLSMTQNYPNGDKVLSPGTVIISTVAEADEVTKVVKPPLKREGGSLLFYIPFNPQCNFNLGGSALSQILSQLGNETPDITDSQYFANTFMLIQQLVREELILSGHDISAGGIVTTLLESTFANTKGGIEVDLTSLQESDSVKLLFSESPAAIIEIESDALSRVEKMGEEWGVKLYPIGKSIAQRVATIKTPNRDFNLDIEQLRDIWYNTSYLYDSLQTSLDRASQRYDNYKRQPLKFNFPELYAKREPSLKRAPIAAVVRERGSSGERELAWVLHLAGFIVKDVHMSDLIGGKESLEDVDFLLFAAGASHSNILGGAKGWSLSFKQNPKALTALHNFYKREGTLSMGVANGAQLMMELSLLTPPNIESHPIVKNSSAKYESAFIGVAINNSPSILLSTLQGSTLGAWFSNEEGKFKTPTAEEELFTAISYSYKEYPGNPANSEESIAALCSRDGRHLATMVHPERGIYPHTWGWYPKEKNDQYSPWIELFVNGRKWFENREI